MKDRIALWDNLKFLLILTVVVGHFAEHIIDINSHVIPARSLFLFIYAFHMPLFIFVSGLFHKNKNISQKVFSFIGIGLMYKIVIYLTQYITLGGSSFRLLEEKGIPWFMFVLAALVLLTYLLRQVNPWLVLLISVLVACFAGYNDSIGDFLCLSRIIVFFPFYFAGTMVRREKLEALNHNKLLKILGLVILLMWAAACLTALDKLYLLRPLFTGRNPFSKVELPYVFLWRFICYAISAVLGLSCILLVPQRRIFAVTTMGQRTMQIYFWHRPALYLLVYLGMSEKLLTSFTGGILWLGLGVVLTVALAWKPLRYPTDLFLQFRSKPSK